MGYKIFINEFVRCSAIISTWKGTKILNVLNLAFTREYSAPPQYYAACITNMTDLIKTINDGDEVVNYSEDSDIEEEYQPKRRKTKKLDNDFDGEFKFVSSVAEYNRDSWNDLQKYVKRKGVNKTDEKIESARDYLKIIMPDSDAEDDATTTDKPEVSETDDELSDLDMKKDTLRKREKRTGKNKKKKGADESTPEEKCIVEDAEGAEDFFEDSPPFDENSSFYQMNLSRPLMKAIGSLNYVHPTPIQAATIPVALLGRDICGCAATGTGKTAAYMLPILERLLYKPKKYSAATRVLILVPTRELGVQVYQVAKQLTQFTTIETGLSVGGLDLKVQEAVLKKRPDIIIATPGRLIDHLQNTPTFCLEDLEVLVLDEADRMLDENFADQMKQIIKMCSRTRQTLLFSATMTNAVNDLAAVCLTKPVRIFVDSNQDVAFNLRQEFVRLREGKRTDRDAILAALVCRTFRDHTMIFVKTKREAHRIMILLGLLGSKAVELHGNLTQPQRLESLRKFRDEEADILIATDVAARGLDIKGVKTVINYVMPPTLEHYIHRVGRTARAGKSGVSVSIASEEDWKILKQIIKRARNPVKNRVIPPDVIEKYNKKLEAIRSEMMHILEEEKTERMLNKAEQDIERGKRLAAGKKDADSSEKKGRQWFQTQRQRKLEKMKAKEIFDAKISGNKMSKKKKKSSEAEEKEKVLQKKMQKIAHLQARQAKRKQKPKRINAVDDHVKFGKGGKVGKTNKSLFANNFGNKNNNKKKKRAV